MTARDNGPVCTVKDWDSKVIPRTTKAVLARHHLEKTCNPSEPINYDDDLADAFFKAGYELALEIGMLCPDTERIVKAEEKEIQQTMKDTPDELTLGTGADMVVMKPRRPEDPYPPLNCVSLGIVVSEELYVPIVTGMIQKKHLVDALHGPSIQTVYGHEIRSGTPYETLMGRYEAQLRSEACFRAGRPGMAQTGIAGATTEYGHLGGMPALAGPGNSTMSLCPVELKVNFANLHRIIQGLNYGNRLRGRWLLVHRWLCRLPRRSAAAERRHRPVDPNAAGRRLLQLLCLRCARLRQLRAGRSVGQQRVDPGRQPEHTLHA